jgi:asparagine synthetase B (glutamine-hydrolysing)
MCGISAIFRFEGDAGADLADLDLMHRAQRHRGLDGEGALVIDRHLQGRRYQPLPAAGSKRGELRLVAAVRRLRISGLRTLADQPLVSADWRHWVMLNGAIYNFPELAAERFRELFKASVANQGMADVKVAIDAAKLRIFVDDYLAGRHEDGYAVWRIYTASRWLELFGL